MILKSSVEKLMRGEDLTSDVCRQVLDEILDPAAHPFHVTAFLVLLRAKQETVEELSAIVTALRDKMIVVPTDHTVLDIVGTGGDGLNSVNISTGSALLAASCGVKIAKHGNRSVSSLTGSADVLEALGVKIQLTPEEITNSISQIGIGFCYSPYFHPVTQVLKHFRRELNVPTTFNLLGPLLNPAKAQHVVLGVLDEALLPIMTDVFIQLGNDRSAVVHGMGFDEITCVGPTKIIEINKKETYSYTIDPLDFGLSRCQPSDLQGGRADRNAGLLLDAFKGKRGAIAETLILNAAVALYLYGLHPSIKDGVAHASHNLYSGEVLTLLNNWIEFSHAQ